MIASVLLAAGLTGVFGSAARDVSALFDRTAQRQLIRAALEQVLQIEVSRSSEGAPGPQSDEADDPEETDPDADASLQTPREIRLDLSTGQVQVKVLKNGKGAVVAPVPPVPPVPPVSAVAPVPPVPPVPPLPRLHGSLAGLPGAAETEDIGPEIFTEHAEHVPAVEVLHRIAHAAGWSLTLVGVGRETIDVDFDRATPRDALSEVLRRARCMGVLRDRHLVVVPVSDEKGTGLIIEQAGSRRRANQGKRGTQDGGSKSSGDMVKVFQGDLVVPSGTVLRGDAVAIWGSVVVQPGAVVQGSVAAIGGSVEVEPGGVVLGDAVALLGKADVSRGGQVLGEHVQIGIGTPFTKRVDRHPTGITRLGPFGLFPTMALFALVYLLGLGALRLSPERVRAMGAVVTHNPLRSFLVGFLCWMLLFPMLVLLLISVVGIPLLPLLPLGLFLSAALGLSALALEVGERFPAGHGNVFVPPAALGMGLGALLIVSLVPWLGTPLLMLLQFVALGAAVSSRYGKALPPH